MDLSVIIVNYNVYALLEKCIHSIYETVNLTIKFEIIVVDNDSTEGSIDDLNFKYPNVKILRLHKNLGFGAANNQAFKIAKGSHFLILNPDITVTENCVKILLNYLAENKQVGVVAPVLYLPNGNYDYYYSFLPSVYSIIMQQFGFYSTAPGMKKRMFDFFDENIPIGKPFSVEQVMGACFMTRRSIYETLGGFDEIYFLYQEETDWEFRITKDNWKIVINPEAKAIHDHHSSANKLGKIYVGFQGIRSIMIYYTKNFSFFKRNLLRLTMIIALFFRGVKYFFVYISKPLELAQSWKYTFLLLIMSLKPRGYLLRSKYVFKP